MKKRVIFNVGNLIKGGAIQAAVNFIVINQSNYDNIFEWFFIISKEIQLELQKLGINIEEKTLNLTDSSTKNALVRQDIIAFENKINPHLVFTLFGPCYINFKALHITGFANGWVTHSKLSSFTHTYKFNFIKMAKALFKYCYYGYHIRQGNAWILETNTAKNGFIKRLRVNKNDCFVVANTSIDFGVSFSKTQKVIINDYPLNRTDNLIVALAADYPHKNLATLIEVAYDLKQTPKQTHFKILLTLDEEIFTKKFLPQIGQRDLQHHIINIGKVDIVDLPKLYSVSFCSILLSHIETFSAVYPESFSTETPVITTDAEFSREICKDAALYVDPNDSKSVAKTINSLIGNKRMYQELVTKGKLLSINMLSPQQKYQKYLEVLRHYVQ